MRGFLCCLIASACALPSFAAGVWEFQGNLEDGSGNGHHARSEKPAFAPGGKGLAAGARAEIPDTPALRLHPGFEAECRFRLDERPEGPQVLFIKDKEYMLRVDWVKEGGHVSFFVHVGNKWESRVRGPVVEPGVWYDVKVGWDGVNLSLQAGDDTVATQDRPGSAKATANPLQFGTFAGVIDRIAIRNPAHARLQLFATLAEPPAPGGSAEARYEQAGDWQAWQSLADGSVRVSPPLAVEAGARPFLCLDSTAPTGSRGEILVFGEGGYGTIPFTVPDHGRTLILEGPDFEFWHGTVHRLGLYFAAGPDVRAERFVLSARPEGRPLLRVRSFAPGRAKLRTDREETLIATVNNLGGDAENVAVEVAVPPGVTLLDPPRRTIEFLGRETVDLISWRIRATEPVRGEARVTASGAGGRVAAAAHTIEFLPPVDLPRTGYVPEPIPATTDYINLMHYCALWKEGTHMGWGLIEPWPDRRPAIGWYDEGTPEVADWHIKYALDHGINGFIYCWYRSTLDPVIQQSLGHAVHEGLFEARYRDRFTFTIMWENGCAEGVKDADDMLDNLLPFWIDNYFTHPSYLKIDNQPVLFVWRPERVGPQLGGTEGTRRTFDAMREQCRARGFAGLRLIGCLDRANPELQQRMTAEGWDAVSGYGLFPQGETIVGRDEEGIPYTNHADSLKLFRGEWERRRDASPLPDIPNVVMGWDQRPWLRFSRYHANPDAANFEAACRDAKELVDAKPAGLWHSRMMVFDNWTEFGEGHYIEPVSGLGFSFVNAIKRVFCTEWAPEEVTDIIPEDVGLEPPERRYQAVRDGYGEFPPWKPRRIVGDLVAHWGFDPQPDGTFADLAGHGFTLGSGLDTAADRGGHVLVCGDGSVTLPAHPAFFPTSGITVSLWCKPSVAKQGDRWMLSSIQGGHEGYRLGLGSGRVAWQIPKQQWSHGLHSPEELPVGVWSHVAATFDNRTMRLYVNGQLVGELDRPGLIQRSRRNITIGAYGGKTACFQGSMDDLRIHNRPLTAEEIAALAAAR